MIKLLNILQRVYGFIGQELLRSVLPFALVGWLLFLVFELTLSRFGFHSVEAFWQAVDHRSALSSIWIRLMVFGLLQCSVWYGWGRLRKRIRPRDATPRPMGTTQFQPQKTSWTVRAPKTALFLGMLRNAILTVALMPFLIQPTLVPFGNKGRHWLARVANLVDGTASAFLVESAVGLYRKTFLQTPIPIVPKAQGAAPRGTTRPTEGRPTPGPGGSRMGRWDPMIKRLVKGDPQRFAVFRAFMFVESGGEQFSVSRTGCLGLMQFCRGTARSGGFAKIFGVGTLYRCDCHGGACTIPRSTRADLESGDLARIEKHRADFPCELTDARFDPDKSLRAGHLYIRVLERRYGGNPYVMYIGYNSGPAVASRLWKATRGRGPRTLKVLAPHLQWALKPYFGRSSGRRARALLERHLPSIARAVRRYGGKVVVRR